MASDKPLEQEIITQVLKNIQNNIRKAYRIGFTHEQIADLTGIDRDTIRAWCVTG